MCPGRVTRPKATVDHVQSLLTRREYVRVRSFGGQPKSRRFTCLAASGGRYDFGVFDACLSNSLRGILERVFVVKDGAGGFKRPPRPRQGAFLDCVNFRRAVVRKVKHRVSAPWTFQQFVDSYPDRRRRTIYGNAVEDLLTKGPSVTDSEVKTFVKAEKVNFSLKPDSAPRVIQPRNPRFNVRLGVYIKPAEGVLYKGVDSVYSRGGRWSKTTIFKGLNAEAQGAVMWDKWSRFARPVAVGLDASRFDQHVSQDALRFEHLFYTGLFPTDKILPALLSKQLVNVGRAITADGIVSYKVEGCRMSGDMNTGLGNCLLMCSMMWSYMSSAAIDRFEFINNGDDCVVIIE